MVTPLPKDSFLRSLLEDPWDGLMAKWRQRLIKALLRWAVGHGFPEVLQAEIASALWLRVGGALLRELVFGNPKIVHLYRTWRTTWDSLR